MIRIKSFANQFLPKDALRFLKNSYREVRGRYYSYQNPGKEVYCPCCDKHFGQFLPFKYTVGINNTDRFKDTYQNTVCPYCYALPRHRIVCHYLNNQKETLRSKQADILMFGAEHSIEYWFQENGFSFTTADLFDRMADVKADIQKIPFPDESWSLIVCNHVLEHVPDFKIALRELKRILKKNGQLELSVPTDRALTTTIENTQTMTTKDRIEKFGQFDHMRIFGQDLKSLLIAEGLNVEIIDGDNLPKQTGAKTGPANYDDNRIYICRKQA